MPQTDDRDLEAGSSGGAVGLLHGQLRAIGFEIDRTELAAQRFGPATENVVRALQAVDADALAALGWEGRAGVVDRPTAIVIERLRDRVVSQGAALPVAPEPGYGVAGTVQDAQGRPLAQAIVTVSDQNLRGSRTLGRSTSDGVGAFAIGFAFDPEHEPAEARSPRDPAAPDLRFAVADAQGRPRRLLTLTLRSAGVEMPVDRIAPMADAPFIVVNASARVEVVLRVEDDDAHPEASSDFEEVEARLAPAMQGLAYDELVEGDGRFQISFLAAETGVLRPIVLRMVEAARSSRLTARQRSPVPVAVFYGLGHAGLPLGPLALARLPRTELTSALTTAVDAAVIPARLRPEIDHHVDTLLSVGAELLLAEPMADGQGLPAWLALSGLAPEAQSLLVRKLVDPSAVDDALWDDMAGDPALGGADPVRRAELVLRLAALTGNHLALVRLMLELPHPAVRSIADLARLDEATWHALVARAGMPPGQQGPEATAQNYARDMMRQTQQWNPTAAIEGLAFREHGRLSLDQDVAEWLAAVREAAASGAVPAIDLGSTHIDRYFEDHGARIGFRAGTPDRLRADLKRLQRTLAIVEEPSQVAPLLVHGHDSAQQVAHTQAAAFVDLHAEALGAASASAIHARATQVHFAHLFVHAMVIDAVNSERNLP